MRHPRPGPVYPSSLGRSIYDGGSFDNLRLRLGEVQKVIPPKDKRSISKRVFEYDVYVQHRDNGTVVSKVYNNCYLSNPFAGLADKLHYTLRSEDSMSQGSKRLGKGSKVLLLCLGGESINPVIIGGLRDPADAEDDPDLGHHLHFVFNGIDAFVNKDGELTITCKGASKLDGTAADSVETKLIGTSVQLLKTGNFKVSTGDGKQTLLIDRKNQLTELRCEGDGSTQFIKIDFANGKIQTTADKAWELAVSNGRASIKSKGVDVGDATDAWMLGTTYRQAEGVMNKKLSAMLQTLQALVQTVGTALTSAGGSMVVPIVGPIVAAPQVTASGAALTAASQIITQMQQAIDAFEQDANKYLSSKNKTD